MPLKRLANRHIIELSYEFQPLHWPEATKIVAQKHGKQHITEAPEVQELLKSCFLLFCNKFRAKLKEVPKASFFVFVHELHEDSIPIWLMLLTENYFNINKSDFAASRRIMKYILEQGCDIDLVGCRSFSDEIAEEIEHYVKHLEELIYLGEWAFSICEFIARSQICEQSVSLQVIDEELTIFTNVPYNSIFEYVTEDLNRHGKSVVLADALPKLKSVLKEKVGLDYDYLYGYIYNDLIEKQERFAVFDLDMLIEMLAKNTGYNTEVLKIFYCGLTINRLNLISVEDGILKTQDQRRYTYRPILEYIIDGKKYWLIGSEKWQESLLMLTTNCMPFGQFPLEWKQIPELYSFMKEVMDNHDALLEDAAVNILKKKDLKYDRNIKSLRKVNNQGIGILKKDLGEIDLIFLNQDSKFIYVIECKHNRSRYEFYNWRRDISNFQSKYEKQLNNKFKWIEANRESLLEHFEVLWQCSIDEKDKYTVCPLFLINAPSLYMYDSDFLVLTLHDLEALINDRYQEVEFEGDIAGKKIKFIRPLLKTAVKLLTSDH